MQWKAILRFQAPLSQGAEPNGAEQQQSLRSDDPEVKKAITMATLSFNNNKNTLEERVWRFPQWHWAWQAL